MRLFAATAWPAVVPLPPDTAMQKPSFAIVTGKLSIYVEAAVDDVLVAGVTVTWK